MPAKYTPEQQIKAFWSRVAITADDNQCWVWLSRCDRYGYGQVTWNRHTKTSHRISWLLTYGDIPNGLCVLHKCDNRKCVNPQHLFLGTNQDNVDDMFAKSRYPLGEKHVSHKLSNSQVSEIRARYNKGETNMSALGREYNVSNVQITRIVNFESRKSE